LWILHRKQFQEVLTMKGKSAKGLTIDVRGAIEEIGLGRVIAEVIREVGASKVIEELGLDAVIRETCFVTRIVLVEANRLELHERTLEPKGAHGVDICQPPW
jgi:hypothetical protein